MTISCSGRKATPSTVSTKTGKRTSRTTTRLARTTPRSTATACGTTSPRAGRGTTSCWSLRIRHGTRRLSKSSRGSSPSSKPVSMPLLEGGVSRRSTRTVKSWRFSRAWRAWARRRSSASGSAPRMQKKRGPGSGWIPARSSGKGAPSAGQRRMPTRTSSRLTRLCTAPGSRRSVAWSKTRPTPFGSWTARRSSSTTRTSPPTLPMSSAGATCRRVPTSGSRITASSPASR